MDFSNIRHNITYSKRKENREEEEDQVSISNCHFQSFSWVAFMLNKLATFGPNHRTQLLILIFFLYVTYKNLLQLCSNKIYIYLGNLF